MNGWIDNHIMRLRQQLEGETSQGLSKKITSRKETDKMTKQNVCGLQAW